MIVTLARLVEKQCPFKDEIDYGRLEIVLDCDEAPELHTLSLAVDVIAATGPMTHEEYTHQVADMVAKAAEGAKVTTWWRTGLWEVSVEA